MTLHFYLSDILIEEFIEENKPVIPEVTENPNKKTLDTYSSWDEALEDW